MRKAPEHRPHPSSVRNGDSLQRGVIFPMVVETYGSTIHAMDERLASVLVRPVFGSSRRVYGNVQFMSQRSRLAEGRSKIGHVVESLLRVKLALLIGTQDL